jgi:E3 ubiquitin-protein ligase UBR4
MIIITVCLLAGYMYYQPLDEQSSAKHGPFYITNVLSVPDIETIEEQCGASGGGCASVYYSHTLQLLFFSYRIGK